VTNRESSHHGVTLQITGSPPARATITAGRLLFRRVGLKTQYRCGACCSNRCGLIGVFINAISFSISATNDQPHCASEPASERRGTEHDVLLCESPISHTQRRAISYSNTSNHIPCSRWRFVSEEVFWSRNTDSSKSSDSGSEF